MIGNPATAPATIVSQSAGGSGSTTEIIENPPLAGRFCSDSKSLRGALRTGLDLVSTNELSEMLNPATFTRMVKAARQRSQGAAAHPPSHCSAHTWATLELSSGVHPKVVQERLGHHSIALTLDTYSHVTEGMDRDAAEKVASLIGGTR